jgi:fibronectin type 3 domain-containing protein
VYYYRIRAYNNKGYTAYSNTVTVTTPQPPLPETPQNLTYAAVRTNQITLKWTDASSYETGFKLYFKTANGTSYSQITLAANTTQYILTGLSPASGYSIKVSAYNGTGESAFSNEITVMTTALQVPNAPSQLNGYASSKSSIELYWTDNATDETGTYIERSLSISSDFKVIDTLSVNMVKFSDKGLSTGTIYYYRVRAYNSEGFSNYSNVFEIRTPDLLPPNAPSRLICTSVYKYSLTLNWTDNAFNETGIFVERYTASLGFAPIDTLPANTMTFSDHGLSGGESYFYRVRAFNGDGTSAYSNIVEVITLTLNLPDPPFNLRADQVNKTTIFLRWEDDNSNEDGFELYRCDSAEAYFKLADLDSNASTYKDQALRPGWNYRYKIRAHNQDGFSSFSESIDVLTPPLNLPNPPSDFKAGNITYEKVVFTWKDNSDNESGFIIERTDPNESLEEIMVLPNTTTIADAGLSENSVYTYRIKAFNGDGASYAPGSVQVNTPKLRVPMAPSELSALNYTANSITVRWEDNSDNETGFMIDRYPASDPDDITEIKVPENDTSYNDINLEPNTSYMYGIQAVNKAGSSSDLMRLFTTLSVAETGRIKDSVIAYYNFTRNPENIIRDLSNYGDPLDLHIADDNAVTCDEDHTLTIMGNTIIQSAVPAKKIIEACKRTNAFSVEMWVKPLDSYNIMESYLLTLDKNESERAFFMAQQFSNFKDTWDYSYVTGLQTVSTGTTGLPYLNLSEDISYINLNHIVYCIDKEGQEKIYMNGVKSAEGYRPGGFDSWENFYFLRLGNSADLTHTWYGTFYLLAIYNKALSEENIMTNFHAGPMDSLEMNILNYSINVFPNPAHDKVNIELIPSKESDVNEKTTLRIVDLNGIIRYEEVVFNPSRYCLRTLPVANLAKGIYLVQVTNGYSYQSSLFVVN